MKKHWRSIWRPDPIWKARAALTSVRYFQGDLGIACQQYDQAVAAYRQSIRVRKELNNGPRVARARIGLAQATLLQGDSESAQRLVTETMAGDDWRGAAQSHQVAFRAYEILAAVGDDKADEMLRESKAKIT